MSGPIPILSIVGRSGSGKTTFIEKLIRELKRRGHRLAVIKHHHHRDFEFDVPGKDSYRFARAGADHVVVAGPTKVAHVQRTPSELSLADVAGRITDVDLIITEGWKREDTPKIEVVRRGPIEGQSPEAGSVSELVASPDRLIAIVSNVQFDLQVPQFGLEDVAGVADLIVARFL